MMRRLLTAVLATATLSLAGCAEDRYPISAERCGPGDPVTTMDAYDCTLPIGPGG